MFAHGSQCFDVEFWESFLFGLLTYIIAIVHDQMHYAHLVKNILNLLVSTFVNKTRAISSCQSRSPSSSLSTFSALVTPLFLLIADSLEKNDWTCSLVSHSSLERSWTTCVSCRSHVRCDLRKVWFPACLCINIKSCGEVRLDFLAKPCPTSP